MPIVYLSRDFSGRINNNYKKLANQLGGMAHVVVEPSRDFSIKLRKKTNASNVYGGRVGVYWPDDTVQTTSFDLRNYDNEEELRQDITFCIRNALLHRRPEYKCTWSYLNDLVFTEKQEQLKLSGSDAVKAYVDVFDEQIKSKEDQLKYAEREIDRLKVEVRKLATVRNAGGHGVFLKITKEENFYSGEIKDIVIDALNASVNNVQSGGRREHVLRDIISSNEKEGISEKYRQKIKIALQDYREMTKKCRTVLEEMGFRITEEGKHIKMVFNEDDRYVYILPKTGGDHRGGLNSVSDISKRIF